MGSTLKDFHTPNNPMYEMLNHCHLIIHNDEQSFIKRLNNITKNNIIKPRLKYNSKTIKDIYDILFTNKEEVSQNMSGVTILMIFIILSLQYKFKLNYIGYSSHTLKNNCQEYYWGKRAVTTNKNLNIHVKHRFDLQSKLLEIIDHFL